MACVGTPGRKDRPWSGGSSAGRTHVIRKTLVGVWETLIAGLVVTAWMPPIIAGAITLADYLAGPTPWPSWLHDWNPVVVGVIVGVASWVVLGALVGRIIGPRTANAETWGEATVHVSELCARVGALTEAGTCPELLGGVCEDVRTLKELVEHRARHALRWATHNGYIEMWQRIHHAEEALILLAELPGLWSVVQINRLKLEGVTGVSPTLLPVLNAIESFLTLTSTQATAVLQPADPASTAAPPVPVVRTMDEARQRLRQVAAAVNAFRDRSLADMVRLRNLTLAALVLTESFAFGILALAIVRSPGDSGKTAIAAGVTFFLVAAVIGLFSRLVSLQGSGPAVNDYGLQVAQLLLIPTVSGLAGLGGVVLSAILFSTSFTSLVAASAARVSQPTQLPGLDMIFNLATNPAGIVFAAVFGFSPALLVSRIDNLAATYKSAIKSTETMSREGG